MAFASISTDLYLPAMPAMSKALGASPGAVEWTVSGYLIGFSIGQLFWGPLADRIGRRIPVAIGIALFILGSAGCALSGNIWIMIAWRIVQAVGACASVVLARAMVRDLYSGTRASQMLSTLTSVMAIAPLVGPFIGGQILALAGWRAIFWLLVIVGAATLAALFKLPETLAPERRNHERLGHAFLNYRDLIRDRALLAYIGLGGFFYAGVYAHIAGTPFAYIEVHHVSPSAYGILFALGIVGIMAMNILNTRMVTRFRSSQLVYAGGLITALSGLALALCAYTGFGGVAGLVIPAVIFVSANGLIVANSISAALANFPLRAGAVSALIGATQYGFGIFGSALVGVFADGTAVPMAAIIAVCGLASLLCAWRVARSR